jgi:hypothetical protein
MRAVILDNEAVQALRDPMHAKHRTVVAHLEGVAQRRRRGASVITVVPTAVRVEAGWDRTQAASAAINRFRINDRSLDTSAGDMAAAINARTNKGVADSHVGATVRGVPDGDVVVLSSDPGDMTLVSNPRAITAVRI